MTFLSAGFTHLLIDLDDTVYPPEVPIWNIIGERINRYMIEFVGIPEADVVSIREHLFTTYGTTLRGLQIEHGISMDHYNEYVHSVSYGDLLKSDIQLRDALLRLPQEKWIFTNANLTHAENVLSQMALRDIFTGIIDINATAPWCKPYPEAFQIALRLCGNPDPARTVFIDDRVPNLDAAASLGLRTILVGAEPSPLHPTVPRLADIQHLFV
ncbi:MAG: pyrimidine 5'-nucleotidase [Chloroflexi bacterium]|nr:pyrimidine 5'-nucleotidase [Chloroflexota bacterium]